MNIMQLEKENNGLAIIFSWIAIDKYFNEITMFISWAIYIQK